MPPPLNRANRDGFVSGVVIPHASYLAANPSLVHFHNTPQKLAIGIPDRRADAVAQMPCRLVSNAKRAFNLEGAHSLLALRHQVDRQKPLRERKVRVMEDRSARHAELIAAGIAVVLVAVEHGRNALGLAARALDTLRPAKFRQTLAALFVRTELLNQVHEINFRLNSGLCFAGLANSSWHNE